MNSLNIALTLEAKSAHNVVIEKLKNKGLICMYIQYTDG